MHVLSLGFVPHVSILHIYELYHLLREVRQVTYGLRQSCKYTGQKLKTDRARGTLRAQDSSRLRIQSLQYRSQGPPGKDYFRTTEAAWQHEPGAVSFTTEHSTGSSTWLFTVIALCLIVPSYIGLMYICTVIIQPQVVGLINYYHYYYYY